MKKILEYSILAASAWLLVSCAWKELSPDEPVIGPQYIYTFNVNSPAVKSDWGATSIEWTSGDAIGAYAGDSKNQSSSVTPASGSSPATINVVSNTALSSGDKVYTYYPFSSANNANGLNAVVLEIPSAQSDNSASAMPMVGRPYTIPDGASSIPADTPTPVGDIAFAYLGSILSLDIYSSNAGIQGKTIQSVSISGTTTLAGSFSYNLSAVDFTDESTLVPGKWISGASSVVITPASSKSVGTSDNRTSLRVVVAPGNYSDLQVSVVTPDGVYPYTIASINLQRGHYQPVGVNLTDTKLKTNEISTADELINFLKNTAASASGEYFIVNDISLSGKTVTAAADFPAGATLDGMGHSITNWTVSYPSNDDGDKLFKVNHGTIKNLTVASSCTFTFDAYPNRNHAPFVQTNWGTISGCVNAAKVERILATTSTTALGCSITTAGFCFKNFGTVIGCINKGNLILRHTNNSDNNFTPIYAGIASYCASDGTSANPGLIKDCRNEGEININVIWGGTQGVRNNLTTKDTKATTAVAGIVGLLENGTVENCTNTGKIQLYYEYINAGSLTSVTFPSSPIPAEVGGIVGHANGTITNCTNSGSIFTQLQTNKNIASNTAPSKQVPVYVGGIAGGDFLKAFNTDNTLSAPVITGCINTGKINHAAANSVPAYRNYIGGVIGYNKSGNIANNANSGLIEIWGYGADCVGGIAGYDTGTLTGCANSGEVKITDTSYGYQTILGGIAGYLNEGSVGTAGANFINNVNEGKITSNATAEKTYLQLEAAGGLVGQLGDASSTYFQGCRVRCEMSLGNYTRSYSGSPTKTVVGGMLVGAFAGTSGAITFGAPGSKITVSGKFGGTLLTSANYSNYLLGHYNKGNRSVSNVEVQAYNDPSSRGLYKIGSFNIRYYNTDDGNNSWENRLPAVISFFYDEHPDIIGLQEIREDQVSDIQALLGYNSFIRFRDTGTASAEDSHDEGNGILWNSERFTLDGSGRFWLAKNPDSKPSKDGLFGMTGDYDWGTSNRRIAVYVKLLDKKNNNQPVYFYATHFDGDKTEARTNSAQIIVSRAKSYTGASNLQNLSSRLYVVGDLNCTSEEEAYSTLASSLQSARETAPVTTHMGSYNGFASGTGVAIDHIFYAGPCTPRSFRVISRKYGPAYISDHYPILFEAN
ncbi:MAG: endonuclease/exonuclease/phosphatase family protein [Bacteroidales bacterium]|nr:endonuclease/exonuclease/phosphatase family protein [Bacteroidales bacterium]